LKGLAAGGIFEWHHGVCLKVGPAHLFVSSFFRS
jgi:hypothetical protein